MYSKVNFLYVFSSVILFIDISFTFIYNLLKCVYNIFHTDERHRGSEWEERGKVHYYFLMSCYARVLSTVYTKNVSKDNRYTKKKFQWIFDRYWASIFIVIEF